MDWAKVLLGIGSQAALAAAVAAARELLRATKDFSKDQHKTGEQPGADSAKPNP